MARSGYLEVSSLQRRRTIPRLSAACERLWTSATAECAALVRGTPLSRAQRSLHSARWATERRDATGRTQPYDGVEILAGDAADIGDYNALLERQEAWFETVMPPFARIDAGPLRLGDTDHRWGLSPFHVPEFCAGSSGAVGCVQRPDRRAQCSSGVTPVRANSGVEAR